MTASTSTRERPIIFGSDMIRAIFKGKTQTRRVIKPQPKFDPPKIQEIWNCPYGQVGERLWVREAFQLDEGSDKIWYRADFTEDDARRAFTEVGDGWKPSIHMPRWASRITLEITGVRAERVQEISHEDAKAEGVPVRGCAFPKKQSIHIDSFVDVWDSLNAKRGFGWESNPWVWAIAFKRIKR
ncbi:MAG: hypothetical protein PHC68_02625 [Syntrophorhabdaceae bacterium]|nr:hypothetical protein [Syntrophorhabdaceae bacterium]